MEDTMKEAEKWAEKMTKTHAHTWNSLHKAMEEKVNEG